MRQQKTIFWGLFLVILSLLWCFYPGIPAKSADLKTKSIFLGTCSLGLWPMSLRVIGEPMCVCVGGSVLGCSNTLSAWRMLIIVVVIEVVQPLVTRQMVSEQWQEIRRMRLVSCRPPPFPDQVTLTRWTYTTNTWITSIFKYYIASISSIIE